MEAEFELLVVIDETSVVSENVQLHQTTANNCKVLQKIFLRENSLLLAIPLSASDISSLTFAIKTSPLEASPMIQIAQYMRRDQRQMRILLFHRRSTQHIEF